VRSACPWEPYLSKNRVYMQIIYDSYTFYVHLICNLNKSDPLKMQLVSGKAPSVVFLAA
jgi:hypothetical protein